MPEGDGEGGPNRLCMIVVSDADADRLMNRLVEAGIPATKVGSSGGFLRRGNATIFSGVMDDRVEELIQIVRDTSRARKEFVPVSTLPFLGEGGFSAAPVEVRSGGAIVFVLTVERFERV
jgi:uncharacterized protein YaaQ